MTKNTDTAMNTATELLAERRKYEGWLAALHERRESTPAHVFTRVLADYEARLEAVVAELKNKADSLDARLDELTARASGLEDDTRAVHDQRAEAELRAHVGELEAGAWEAAAREADERLATLGEERTAVEGELASLRALLGAARQPTPSEASIAVSAAQEGRTGRQDASTSPAEAAAGGDAPLITEPAAGATLSDKPARNTGGFDELAFLRDVAGRGEEPAAPPAPAREQPAAGREPELELELPPPAPERPVKDTLGIVLPDERPALPARRASTEIPFAANVTGNTPIILETGGKQDKTLKCTDCGSMNYPTEWYCERCGAELAAL